MNRARPCTRPFRYGWRGTGASSLSGSSRLSGLSGLPGSFGWTTRDTRQTLALNRPSLHRPPTSKALSKRLSSFGARRSRGTGRRPLTTLNVFAQDAPVAQSETTLFLGLLTSPRYTLLQNAIVPSEYRWSAFGNHNQSRPAGFPPLPAGNFRITRPVAILSTPCDEGTNPCH